MTGLFTPAMVTAQQQRGGRRRVPTSRFGPPPEAVWAFVSACDTVFLSTASADGRPYVQHRGGPPGFLVQRGPSQLAFADFSGNRQYITVGNLSENDRVMMILLDFATARRLKLWGRAQVVEGPEASHWAAVLEAAGGARVERIITIDLEAWDWNCRQHITRRYTAQEWHGSGGRP